MQMWDEKNHHHRRWKHEYKGLWCKKNETLGKSVNSHAEIIVIIPEQNAQNRNGECQCFWRFHLVLSLFQPQRFKWLIYNFIIWIPSRSMRIRFHNGPLFHLWNACLPVATFGTLKSIPHDVVCAPIYFPQLTDSHFSWNWCERRAQTEDFVVAML